MELKYIMIEQKFGTTMRRRIPVLFFESLTHIGMWEAMQRCDDIKGSVKLVSAGFVVVGQGSVRTHGSSESLKLKKLPHKPLPEDAETIATQNYMHGLIT